MFGVPKTDCPIEDGCLEWVRRYLMDCVCNRRDQVSLALGLVSVTSWAVAEIPQIISNFREGSTEGMSVAFLMTWIAGDIFNLAGCYLEPATLPTQLSMAILYTATTVLLLAQTIYYKSIRPPSEDPFYDEEASEESVTEGNVESPPTQPVAVIKPWKQSAVSSPISSQTPINVPRRRRSSGELYYMSARSLASSHTPTAGSYFVGSRGGHSFLHHQSPLYHSNGSLQEAALEGLITPSSHQDHNNNNNNRGLSTTLRTAVSSILVVGTLGLSSRLVRSGAINSFGFTSGLQRSTVGEEASPVGQIFGWLMAAIYMGGRFPQIWLNMKRGTVEGLSPFMFVFAVVGNTTYVGSILVRSTAAAQILPNIPWLVDAGVCVVLDCFILCQFIYYYAAKSKSEEEDVKKPLLV